jgi:dihydropyrimidinase
MVVLHTENIEVVNRFRRKASAAHETLKDWCRAKPPFTEAENIVRACYFAEHLGAKIYIPHLSTRIGARRGAPLARALPHVYVETCPHYLTHTRTATSAASARRTRRSARKDDVDAMWEGLADGTIDVVASDHVPRKRATKEKPLWQASQGFPARPPSSRC